MPPAPGERFGRYELVKVLGSGAMGDVFAAHDALLQRRVALKVVRTASLWEEGLSAEESAARLLREARAAARISHPNAVAVFDVGEIEGRPFLVMEYIDGTPLRAFIGDPSVPLERRIEWLAGVARGLAAAHALGIVHRDVKPDNVMVSRDGVVKVLDFGIARRAERQADATLGLGTLTAEGLVLGTPLYMAPEQLRGERIDGRADQFAWGVIAYELLTGGLPWDASRGGVVLASQILSHEPEPPRSRVADLPAEIDLAVLRALRKATAERFAKMDDLVAVLEPFGEPAVSERADAARFSTPSIEEPAAPRPEGVGAEAKERRGSSRAHRTRWAWLFAGSAGIAVGAFVVKHLNPQHTNGPSALDASAPAVPLTTESRMSPIVEATEAYRAGVEAEKNASLELARMEFDHAVTLDPEFSAAHLRRALLADVDITDQMREDIEKARNGRALLGDHDAKLLDAIEPWMRAPPDLAEAKRRFDSALRDHPDDPDFGYEVGWVRYHSNDFVGAAAAFDALLEQDPRLPLAWYMKGRSQAYGASDLAPPIDSFRRCLAISPRATSCLEGLAKLEAMGGDCRGMADTAGTLVEVAGDLDVAYLSLAEAKESLGQPANEVLSALHLEWNHVDAYSRPLVQASDLESLAVLRGDFGEAERQNEAYERALPRTSDDVIHWGVAYERMLLAFETGNDGEVVRLAREYLGRRAAWQANDFGVEPTMYVYALEFKAHGLSRDDFANLREEWIARDERRVHDVGGVDYAWARWAVAETPAVTTPDEAIAAIATMPAERGVNDALDFVPYLDEPVGRTLFLAGRWDEAIAALSRLSGTCAVLEASAPLFSTWAAFDLGRAFEAKHDTTSSCRAYARVLARWGSADPPSRTAAKALARVRSLGCPR